MFEAATVAEFEVVLLSHAEVRTRRAEHGQPARPVLCVDCRPASTATHTIHAEIVYDEAHRAAAQALAAKLRRGMHFNLATSFAGARISLPHAQRITPITHPAGAPCASTTSSA